MKINNKGLSLPPYISTSWKNVSSLKTIEGDEPVLIITLVNGIEVEVPHLSHQAIEEIFYAHGDYLESLETHRTRDNLRKEPPRKPSVDTLLLGQSFPLRITGIEGLLNLLKESGGELSFSSDLPKDMTDKIMMFAKAMGLDDQTLAEVLKGQEKVEAPVSDEEVVTEEDLKFKDWEIEQLEDKLFLVTNPLDHNEFYKVYLGTPIGCTCGDNHCEHIKAALRS